MTDTIDRYIKLGLVTLPAFYGKKRPSLEWKKYQNKPPSEKQIREWFSNNRKQNVAILCGKPSKNLVVLDFDDPTIYPKFFDRTKIEKETLVVKTGSGKCHVYLRTDKPFPSFKIPQLKLEIRSDGNIVIAPPSKHPSGKPYKFLNPSVKRIFKIADLENYIWEKAEKLGVEKPKPLFKEEREELQDRPYEGPDPPCMQKLLEGVEEGSRNEAGIRLASYFLKFKRTLSPNQVLEKLESWNTLNKPPFQRKELKDLVKSAIKLERSYGCRLNQAWCNVDKCPLKKNQLLNEEAKKEAERILDSPDVLSALKRHLDNIIAGEDENKQLAFILLSSGKTDDPKLKQFILLKGESGAGKTTLMKLADAFKTKSVGRFSPHALDYSNLKDYEILRLQEIGNLDQEFQGVSTIKFLSGDDKGYTVEVAERDDKGRFATRQYRVPPITLITSTTRVNIDRQFERRSWILNPDETRKQTERIRKWKIEHEKDEGLVKLGLRQETRYSKSIRVFKEVVKRLDSNVEVALIFPDSLTKLLKSERLRVRGDYDKIITLVKLHAFLNQRTLPRAEGTNDKPVVFVTLKSAFQALKMALKPFTTMTMELEERSRKLFGILEDMGLSTAGSKITPEIREKIAVKLEVSDRTVHRYLEEWRKAGYISKLKDTSRKGHPVTFRLLYDLSSIAEKKAVSLDINNASTKIGSKMRKEIEKWLEQFLDKITPRTGWTRKKMKEVLLETDNTLQKSTLSKKETGKEKGSISKTKQTLLVASSMSKEMDTNPKKKPVSSNSHGDKECCSLCHKPLPENMKYTKVYEGKPVHLECEFKVRMKKESNS